MKLFTCTAFRGHYPIGTAAVVIAQSREEAKPLLEAQIARHGLAEQDVALDSLQEVDMAQARALILLDGNY